MPLDWFARMGDIPGLTYEPPSPVDRSKLRGLNARPTVNRFSFDGTVRESLGWDPEDWGEHGGSMSSPCRRHLGDEYDVMPTSELLTRLWESLEVPGEPSDFHFSIQGVASTLWSRKSERASVIGWVEWLYLLDIRLVEALPSTVHYDDGYRSGYYAVTAFHELISLYTAEGYLDLATSIATRASQFEQQGQSLKELRERKALLAEEDIA